MMAVDMADEAITTLRQCLNEDRLLCRLSQSIAQPTHRRIKAVLEINKGIVRPEPCPKLLPAYHVARPFQQRRQDFKRLLLDPYLKSIFAKLTGAHIHLKDTKLDHRRLTDFLHGWRQ